MSICISDFLNSGAIMSLSPDRLLVGWGKAQRKNAQELDPYQPAFYFSDFFLTKSLPWIQYTHWAELTNNQLNAQLLAAPHLERCEWNIDQLERFKWVFKDLENRLQADQLQKIVPYLFAKSSSQMTTERLGHCLKRSLQFLTQKAGYLYGHWHSKRGVLGITPELLFSHSQQHPQILQTMALAGTCHPSQCQEAFFQDEKEQYEHHLVVQGICHALQQLGCVKIGPLQLLQLPRLTHLMTSIEVQLQYVFHFDSYVHCLHPTPALGASPRNEGKKWLEEYQKHTPRRYYGAPIGFKYPQKGLSTCLIGIRNVQWDVLGMLMGAGCGVVKQSVFEKEWQEIQFKIKAIQEQLDL